MIPHAGLGTAVVAIDPRLGVSKFFGHRLCLDGTRQDGELHFHIDDGAAADRTAIGRFHVFVVAAVMDAVAAAHKDDSLRRGEHVFAADGTVTIGGTLNAAVCVANGN